MKLNPDLNPVPLVILLVIGLVNLGVEMGKHGQPTDRKHNGWLRLLAMVITLLMWWWVGIIII